MRMRAASAALVLSLILISGGAQAVSIISIELPKEWGENAKDTANHLIDKLIAMGEERRREAIPRLVTAYISVAAAKRSFAEAIQQSVTNNVLTNNDDPFGLIPNAREIKKSIDGLNKIIQDIDPTWASASTANAKLYEQIQSLQQAKIQLVNKTITMITSDGKSVHMGPEDAMGLSKQFRDEADSLDKLAEEIVAKAHA